MDIDPDWWATAFLDGKRISDRLAERDVTAILRFLRIRGFSRARLAALTGLSETRVRQISQGRQRVTSYEVLGRIADGLSIPRLRLGLAANPDSPPVGDPGSLADPALHDSWSDLLNILTARSNSDGCAGLRRAIEGQCRLINSARTTTTGTQRRRLTAAAAHWVEFRSWIDAHGDRPERTDVLLDRAYALAVEAGNQQLAAYMVMRKSQQALDAGAGVRAVRLARQPQQENRRLPPRVLALCLVHEAEGHAMTDDATASRECIDKALGLICDLQDTQDELGGHCTVDFVRASEARCRQTLGESAAAARTYEDVLAVCSREGRLDEGMWRADPVFVKSN
jgi:transcriptional regulator with XRE-family HTH domain